MRANTPVVGVIASSVQIEGEAAQAVRARYLEGIAAYAGAAPVIVPVDQPAAHAGAILSRLDGLLLTGSSSNIEPARYGSNEPRRPPIDAARDRFSLALVRGAIELGVPLFGICRGLQEINVALGGTLIDGRAGASGPIAHHGPDGDGLAAMFGHSHDVEIVAGTLLAGVAGTATIRVNSVHYQRVDILAPGLIVNARSADGVVEAISLEGARAPVFAVQWHPEWRPAERAHDLAFWRLFGETVAGAHSRSFGGEKIGGAPGAG